MSDTELPHCSSLPEGFESLERLVADWVLPDTVSRMEKRQSSSIEELREFYDALLPLGEAALVHLRTFQLGSLPAPSERLLKLMLSLAEVAPAVEWYGAPDVTDGFPVSRIHYLRQVSDTAPQY